MDEWFQAAFTGNTEYLVKHVSTLGGTKNRGGSTALIRAIYAHQLEAVKVLAKYEYYIADVSKKYPAEIALKVRFYDACLAILMAQDNEELHREVENLKTSILEKQVNDQEVHERLTELVHTYQCTNSGKKTECTNLPGKSCCNSVNIQNSVSCSEIPTVEVPFQAGKQTGAYAPASLSMAISNCIQEAQNVEKEPPGVLMKSPQYDVKEVLSEDSVVKQRTCPCSCSCL